MNLTIAVCYKKKTTSPRGASSVREQGIQIPMRHENRQRIKLLPCILLASAMDICNGA